MCRRASHILLLSPQRAVCRLRSADDGRLMVGEWECRAKCLNPPVFLCVWVEINKRSNKCQEAAAELMGLSADCCLETKATTVTVRRDLRTELMTTENKSNTLASGLIGINDFEI